jgi:hypothetical protein
VTTAGGENNDGTVFEIVRTGPNEYNNTPITVVSFGGPTVSASGSDPTVPSAF